MASFASSNRTELSIAKESTPGTLEPLFYDSAVVQRYSSESMSYDITNTSSTEIRSDRMLSDLVQTDATVGGDMSIEFSASSYNPLIEGTMADTFNTPTALYNVTDFVAATTSTATSAGTNFDISTLVMGQYVKLSGGTVETANNIYAQISRTVAPTTATLTFEGTPLTVATTDAVDITESAYIRNGTVDTSFSIIRTLNDATAVTYYSYAGNRVSSMNLDFATGSILTGSFAFLGQSATSSETIPTGTPASETPASTTEVLNSVGNIANVWLDNATSASEFASLSIAVNTGARELKAIGTLGSISVKNSQFDITGNISLYFDNLTMYNNYLNSSSFSLAFSVEDAAGNAYVFSMPRVKFESLSVVSGGLDTDIMADGTWKATLDPDSLTMLQIDRWGTA